MRAILIATLLAASAGLAGTSSGSAAPANGASISQAAIAGAVTADVRYYRKRKAGRACYTKCYYELIIGPRVCRTFC